MNNVYVSRELWRMVQICDPDDSVKLCINMIFGLCQSALSSFMLSLIFLKGWIKGNNLYQVYCTIAERLHPSINPLACTMWTEFWLWIWYLFQAFAYLSTWAYSNNSKNRSLICPSASDMSLRKLPWISHNLSSVAPKAELSKLIRAHQY